MGVSKNRGAPKSMVFLWKTLLFRMKNGGENPLFSETPFCDFQGVLFFNKARGVFCFPRIYNENPCKLFYKSFKWDYYITWDDESKTTILANPRLLLLRCADPGCFCIISNINSSIRIQTRQFFCYSWNLGHRKMCKISDHSVFFAWMVIEWY